METDPGKMTWADVAMFIREAHLDRKEYFSVGESRASFNKDEIWGKGYPSAYWLAGGSEGWYVHVARNVRLPGKREPVHEDLMLGKFWTPQDASFAAELVTRFMNGVFKNVDELIAEGRARMD
jgi:hypothetical protein